MTCPFCETWIGDDDHRCSRCARRVRAVPSSLQSNAYPVTMTGAARVFHFPAEPEIADPRAASAVAQPRTDRSDFYPIPDPAPGQQTLFTDPVNPPRVVEFDNYRSGKARDTQRSQQRTARPAPVETGKVELRRPRGTKRKPDQNQPFLDFYGTPDLTAPPPESLICDAPVAIRGLRLRAWMIDASLVTAAIALGALTVRLFSGVLAVDRSTLPFALVAVLTVPLLYKILWVFFGRDSLGMQHTGLRLVDFDGNPPTRKSRYLRLFGSAISMAAAGVGLIWSFVDEDKLTWHDHISETFPTLAGEDASPEEDPAPFHFTATAG